MRAYACILVESQQITDLSVRFDAESIQEKKKRKKIDVFLSCCMPLTQPWLPGEGKMRLLNRSDCSLAFSLALSAFLCHTAGEGAG